MRGHARQPSLLLVRELAPLTKLLSTGGNKQKVCSPAEREANHTETFVSRPALGGPRFALCFCFSSSRDFMVGSVQEKMGFQKKK